MVGVNTVGDTVGLTDGVMVGERVGDTVGLTGPIVPYEITGMAYNG